MTDFTIKTSNRPMALKYTYEVPVKVLKDQFDWLDLESKSDRFICYKKQWYYLGEFMRVHSGQLKELGYDGYHEATYFSGVLIKIVDSETVIMATFYY